MTIALYLGLHNTSHFHKKNLNHHSPYLNMLIQEYLHNWNDHLN